MYNKRINITNIHGRENVVHFITYGNENFNLSKKRLFSEVERLHIFDKIIAYGPEDFDSGFKEKHARFIENNSRGGGYWLWKPYFIVKTLENMNDNDILVYADAGCKVYPKHKKRLYQYFNLVKENKFGLLNFQMSFVENQWTKSDVAKRIEVLGDEKIMNSGQICATVIVIRKCVSSIKIMKEWYSICSEDYHFIDDSPSLVSNHLDFIEHRHDQSVLSLIIKKNGSKIIPDETWLGGISPLSANRIEDFSLKTSYKINRGIGKVGKFFKINFFPVYKIIKPCFPDRK